MQVINDFASTQGYTVRALGSTGSVFSGGAEVARFDPYRVSFFAVDGAALHCRADSADLAWWLGLAPVAAPVVEPAAVKTHYQIVKCGDGEGTGDEVIATVEGSFGDALAAGRELARGKGITLRFVLVTEGELQAAAPVLVPAPAPALAEITTARGRAASEKQIARARIVRDGRLSKIDAQIDEYDAVGEGEAVEILRVLRASLCVENDAAVILDAWDSLWCYDLETIVSTPRSRSDYVRAVHAKSGAEPLIQTLIAKMRH